MAIYHLSVKPVSRSAGRSATAAAAYRAGCEIADERTGEIHDYTRKGGVESADIVLPDGSPEWATDRAKLWNAAELAEKRKDACVAREFEVALPSELSPAERRRLALDFAKDMANREGCAVDVAIHAPGRKGDNRNGHAHMLRTTRKVEADGMGGKLDTEKAGRKRSDDLKAVRAKWADLTNERLRENGIAARVDHRSNEARGIEELPSQHMGPAVAGLVSRGEQSHVLDRVAEQAAVILARQVLDAQAAAERLRRQALQAEMEVQAEMEAEWIQAELAQEAEDEAERQAQFEQLAKEQAEADAAAAAAAAEEQAKAAVARAKAAQAVQAAHTAQERAQAALDAAERTCLALRPAYDAAMSEQRQAGAAGLLATARALPKAAGWQRAIDAYHEALQALKHAQKVLQRAGKVLSAALAKLEILDPSVREAREARERATRQAYEAQQSRIAKASADAAAARGHSRGGVVPKDYLDRNADEHESSFVDDESSESGR